MVKEQFYECIRCGRKITREEFETYDGMCDIVGMLCVGFRFRFAQVFHIFSRSQKILYCADACMQKSITLITAARHNAVKT
jgi:hypothetical protein